MSFSMGFILVLAILIWIASSRYEWSIPLKWQVYIGAWKERFGDKSYNLNLIWELGPENEEMEIRFWLLQRALPSLQKNNKLPLWIEVEIYPDLSLGLKEKYITCLQRRFSEIKIYVCPRNCKGGDGGNIKIE